MELLARPESKTTWHSILSFNPTANNYLRNLTKGSQVYVEANFELREPEPDAEPETYQGQRHIFLRHGENSLCFLHIIVCAQFPLNSETLRVLKYNHSGSQHEASEASESSSENI
jgi:hypothetical protein